MEKTFGKHNDLALLIIGFVLTTLIGTPIGLHFQNRNWEEQNRIESKKIESNRAEEFFKEFSTLLDNRLYQTRLIHWSKSKHGSIEERTLASFKLMQNEWIPRLNVNEALLDRYFGTDALRFFDKNLLPRYNHLYDTIAKSNYSHSGMKEGIEKEIDALNNSVSYLNLRMIWAIEEQNVGTFRTSKVMKEKKDTNKR